MNTDWILPISRSDDQAWLKLLQVYSSPDTSTSERITARTDFLSETNRAAIIQSHLIKDLACSQLSGIPNGRGKYPVAAGVDSPVPELQAWRPSGG